MEEVVLVDEQNKPLGTAPKDTVHNKNTPLHRGFSVFIFNSKGELLITKRSDKKKTFPGVWSNTVCGHPAPQETVAAAAKRRLLAELGIKVKTIEEISPYRYRFSDKNGIVENEVCPVLVGYFDGDPKPDKDEVSRWKWLAWEDFLKDSTTKPDVYSPWSREEARIIQMRENISGRD